jgi:hypothetical protein
MSFAFETAVGESESKTNTNQPESLTAQPDQQEVELTVEIDVLWRAHGEANATRKHTTAELRRIKLQLGERLHAAKQLLSKPGRGGQWHAWLRARKIPRSSGDKLVERYLESVRGNAQACAIPAEDAIGKLLAGFVQKAKQLISDDIARYQFGYRLLQQLGLEVQEEDECFVVIEPEAELDEPYDDETGEIPYLLPYHEEHCDASDLTNIPDLVLEPSLDVPDVLPAIPSGKKTSNQIVDKSATSMSSPAWASPKGRCPHRSHFGSTGIPLT